MADEQFDRLTFFRNFIAQAEAGAEVPTVEESDLRILHQVCVDMAKCYSGKDGVVLCQEDAQASCCTKDEGSDPSKSPCRRGLQTAISCCESKARWW
jgi:hypothetical protein